MIVTSIKRHHSPNTGNNSKSHHVIISSFNMQLSVFVIIFHDKATLKYTETIHIKYEA